MYWQAKASGIPERHLPSAGKAPRVRETPDLAPAASHTSWESAPAVDRSFVNRFTGGTHTAALPRIKRRGARSSEQLFAGTGPTV